MLHRKTYATISLDKLNYNLEKIQSQSNKSLFCVVKANAYGHGIIEISKYLIKQPNIKYLCVSSIDEAVLLRQSLEDFPIINLGYTDIEDIETCIENDITVTLPSLDWFNSLISLSLKLSPLKIHVKLDTGMNRLGIKSIDEYQTVMTLAKTMNIEFEGIFSHYHSSDDEDNSSSFKQLELFKKFLNCQPYDFKWIHIANSDAIIDGQETISNAVRCGLSMYGYSAKTNNYKPILSLYTTITQVKSVSRLETISYSATHIIEDERRIAILPIGYADGLNRKLQNTNLYINDIPVKIIGRICMDQTIIEYPCNIDSHLVEVIGDHQDAADLAKHLETIPYEILTSLSNRITRKYVENGRLISETSLID
jgi:alanine racemase